MLGSQVTDAQTAEGIVDTLEDPQYDEQDENTPSGVLLCVRCAAHTLQLCICDVLKKDWPKSIINKVNINHEIFKKYKIAVCDTPCVYKQR